MDLKDSLKKQTRKMKKNTKKTLKKGEAIAKKEAKRALHKFLARLMNGKHNKNDKKLSQTQKQTIPTASRKKYNLGKVKTFDRPMFPRDKDFTKMYPSQYHFFKNLSRHLDKFREHVNQANKYDDYTHMQGYKDGQVTENQQAYGKRVNPEMAQQQGRVPEYHLATQDAKTIYQGVKGTEYEDLGKNLYQHTNDFVTKDRAVGNQLQGTAPNATVDQTMHNHFSPKQRDDLMISRMGATNAYTALQTKVADKIGTAKIVAPKINGYQFAQDSHSYDMAQNHYKNLASVKGSNYFNVMNRLSISATNRQTISSVADARKLNHAMSNSKVSKLRTMGSLQKYSLNSYKSLRGKNAQKAYVKSDGYSIKPIDHNDVKNYKFNAQKVLNSKNPEQTYQHLAQNDFQAPKQYSISSPNFAKASQRYEKLCAKTNDKVNSLGHSTSAKDYLHKDSKGNIMSIQMARSINKSFKGKTDADSKLISKNLTKGLDHYSLIPKNQAKHLYVQDNGHGLTPIQDSDVDDVSHNVNKALSAKPQTPTPAPKAPSTPSASKDIDGPDL